MGELFIKPIKGYILISTLMMIMILSLLLLSQMQELMLYAKMQSRYEIYHQDFYKLESMLLKIIHEKTNNYQKCQRQGNARDEAIHDLMDGKGCQLTDKALNYVLFIEDLGIDHCLLIRNNNLDYAAHQWRYSLGLVKDQELRSVLQMRLIGIALKKECLNEEKIIYPGISSWRYLPDIDDLKNT